MSLKDIFTNKRFWLITGVSIVFIIIAVYTYRTYIAPNTNYIANKEFVDAGESDNACGPLAPRPSPKGHVQAQ